MIAALEKKDNEAFEKLFNRLDSAIYLALEKDEFIDVKNN